jgi:hypothetical protein
MKNTQINTLILLTTLPLISFTPAAKAEQVELIKVKDASTHIEEIKDVSELTEADDGISKYVAPYQAEIEALETKYQRADSKYFQLVNERFKPKDHEYYLEAIFKTRGKSYAKITRSKQERADELFKASVVYTEGQVIDDQFFITSIDARKRKVRVYNLADHKEYELGITYGNAVSRLVPVN